MDPFDALADPVRRRLLDLVHAHPRTAGALAEKFEVSRPAVSRHLRVLREAGLVTVRTHGRERTYEFRSEALATVDEYVSRLRRAPESAWEQRLDALATEVHRTRRDRQRHQPTDHQGETA